MTRWIPVDLVGLQEKGFLQGAYYVEQNLSLVFHLLLVQDICLQVDPKPLYLSQSNSGHLFSSFLQNYSPLQKKLSEWLIDEMSLWIC